MLDDGSESEESYKPHEVAEEQKEDDAQPVIEQENGNGETDNTKVVTDKPQSENHDQEKETRVIHKPKRRLNPQNKKKKKLDPAVKCLFDLEADLGSDNEAHDDRVKKIKGDEKDESDDEDSLVDDSFIDNAVPLGDDAKIGKADAKARKLFMA